MSTSHILVVEDDPNIAELLAFMLEHAGHRVDVLGDGRAAQKLIADSAPVDLAIFDVMLPYTDGYALTASVRAQPAWRGVPVLMLTAKSLPADLARGREVGVTAYLTKPFEPEELLAEVARLLPAASGPA